MHIEKIIARQIKDSRNQPTIQVILATDKNKSFLTSAPSGKSKGKYEVKSYNPTLQDDIIFLNNLKIQTINNLKIKKFNDLIKLEELLKNKIGGNSMFALESSILKALAHESKKPLWKFLSKSKKTNICPVGNAIGGGLHSKGIRNTKPDFQEFLFIPEAKTFKQKIKINQKAYILAKTLLKAKYRNDEGAWETSLSNKEVLDVMEQVRDKLKKQKIKINIGLDIASSGFFKDNKYFYKNKKMILSKQEQIYYLSGLIHRYNIFYIEDGLEENDFNGFSELRKRLGDNCLIVGDDLTTTNLERTKKAIKNKSVNAIIIKPNQIGSLIETKKVIDLCKKHKIKTIISHRSGETLDTTISDLAIAFKCDFIKTGIYGKTREVKLKRIEEIE